MRFYLSKASFFYSWYDIVFNGVRAKIEFWDSTLCVIYELIKFLKLIYNNNSNILKTFWLDVDFYLDLSPVGKDIISYGQPFIYQKIIANFGGYVYSQIKRVTNK